ncbi:retrovirus-related pol polyprotein from transposon TNT 1-94 [Tanacetum coccineum]
MSQDVMICVMNSIVVFYDVNLEMKKSESCNKCLDLDVELLNKQNAYNVLLKSYSQLEKYCISLESTMQLNQQIFQNDKSCNNQNALDILEYFKNNDLKAQLQAKDTTICNLKEHIKSIRENNKEEKVKQEMDEIETINIELEHRMFKLDIEPPSHRLKNNRDAHEDYLKKTIENTETICGLVERARKHNHSEPLLDSACKFTKHVESSKTLDSNTPVLPSTGLKSSTSTSRSHPTSNKNNDRISQTPSSNMKNKVKGHPRRVKYKSNKKNHVKDHICDANVKHTMLNANSELICVKCKQCMFDANHDVCFLDFVNDVNVRSKSKSAKKSQQHNIWKPMGKVFTEVGYTWKPIGRLFTLVGNLCPLTRFTSTKVVQIVLWYLDSGCSKHMTKNRSQLMNFVSKFLGTVRFRNNQIAKIMGYGDYQLGNVTISRVYYVEGLGHNLFFVGQFCDSDLEVAFWKNTCFIRNLDGVDLLSGSRDIKLYIISLDDMLKTSLICLLSKASKTKGWLWHRQLSHLNFGTLNKLAKDGLAQGIPKLKFKKYHLCSACALGKSKKSSHQPKTEDTNQEKLYLLHMDLCGPMRVESINGKVHLGDC